VTPSRVSRLSSLRREVHACSEKKTLIFKRTGGTSARFALLLDDTNMQSMVRYLGHEIDVAKQIDV
jgi:hypothetical protein